MVPETMTRPAPKKKALPKFLLVDDLEENLLALSAVLGKGEAELHTATSARDALELLLVHDFALALVDVQMPDMDGFELAELMRQNERTRRVPIIFVTAGGRDAERRFQGYEAGAVDFLWKPLDVRILRHKVDVFVELYKQRAELAENLRLNEELVAIVTHDLRSPLASILMVADVLAKESKDAYVTKQMQRIHGTSRQLLDTVNELLDLSRARLAGGIPVEPSDVDLSPIVSRAVGNLATAHPARKIELEVRGTAFRGRWDGARIEQVVTNLVFNALAHGSPSSPVRVELVSERPHVRIVVKNDGRIPEDVLPKVFEPFQRGPRTKRGNGLGLGLYIVDQIVTAHGGTVGVKSDEEGTVFDVALPRKSV